MPRLLPISFDNRSVIISRIMLRFRPIAPKPTVCGERAPPEQDNACRRRNKRKYVRVRGRKHYCMRRKKAENKKPSPPDNSEVEDASSPEKEVVTLQLLPERSERSIGIPRQKEEEEDIHRHHQDNRSQTDRREVGSEAVTETWIIVERVSGADTLVLGLGFSDKEKMESLERDTCPGFVSDGRNKVVWVNEAYKRMVGTGFTVWLVVKEPLPQTWSSFACRVRFVQLQPHGSSKVVPCDVWRMDDFAGFAWKLDFHTALTLSL